MSKGEAYPSSTQEDDFENTSCNNRVIRICGLKSISHCDHFGVEDYSQEGQEDHLDDDHDYAKKMDDAEPLEHIHVQEHQDRFDDHEDEQDGGDDGDNPERVKLNSIE